MKGATKPKGFFAGGVSCGIKKQRNPDLALIYSQEPCFVAGMFTKNRFKAAPVLFCQRIVKKGRAQAIIINSGNANCATANGYKNVIIIADAAAEALALSRNDILVCSTGIIGRELPVGKIKKAIPALVSNMNKTGDSAASAIMTTDKIPKQYETSFRIGVNTINIGGMAKGSGMIAPNLATMLGFITTDANISPRALKDATKYAVERSFNRITVDADTSTNDTLLVMANCLAGNKQIQTGRDFEMFKKALTCVCWELCKKIVADGEGATKVIRITVKGAHSKYDAYRSAKSIANSNLVKTAVYGCDPNWGRIISSLGASGAKMTLKKLRVCIGKIVVFENGLPTNFKPQDVQKELKKSIVAIDVDLRLGNYKDFFLTCDLTEEYIKINSRYAT
jgi:glutamate N-acetyltransferase/amino-acid N-acetyltransferase